MGMKYDTIYAYCDYLQNKKNPPLALQTAQTYKKCIERLLNDQFILNCCDLDFKLVLEKLKSTIYKNEFSKYKNALIYFCEYINLKIPNEVMSEIKELATDKKKKHRKLKAVSLKSIQDHIRVIQDKKLKLSFQTMLKTGLRISELAQIKNSDCTINDNYIELVFIGKGRDKETVKVLREKSKYFSDLKELIQNTDTERKVFYSANYLQTKAVAKGFSCHDLRRAFAKLKYQETKRISEVQEALRHKRIKTTKIYLKSKVRI